MDARDLGAVAKAAHRVKGACRTVGAKDLAEVTGRIEDAGRRGDRAAMAAARFALEREARRLADWLLQSVD
jgi:HPt (histidine-containing phosphotransfer) domain-containing protein